MGPILRRVEHPKARMVIVTLLAEVERRAGTLTARPLRPRRILTAVSVLLGRAGALAYQAEWAVDGQADTLTSEQTARWCDLVLGAGAEALLALGEPLRGEPAGTIPRERFVAMLLGGAPLPGQPVPALTLPAAHGQLLGVFGHAADLFDQLTRAVGQEHVPVAAARRRLVRDFPDAGPEQAIGEASDSLSTRIAALALDAVRCTTAVAPAGWQPTPTTL